MKKYLIAAAASMAVLTTATPAMADPPRWAPAHGYHKKHKKHYKRHYQQPRYYSAYDANGYYREPRRISYNDRVWRGNDGRYYCRRDNGTTGLVIGAGVGAMAGHELARNGDRTLGVILGAAIGGLLGRTIDRGDIKCR